MSEKPNAQVGGSHYDKPMQHVDVMVANKFTYLESQAMKYLWRHSEKNGVEDIKKSMHYVLFIMMYEYGHITQDQINQILDIVE